MTKCIGTPRRKSDETGSGQNTVDDGNQKPESKPTPKRRKPKTDEQKKISSWRTPLEDLIVPRGGSLTARQQAFVKHYTYLSGDYNSRYIAFLLAGFTGCKEDCDLLMMDDRIQKAIRRRRISKFQIDDSQLDLRSKMTEKNVRIIETALSKGMTIANSFLLANIEPAAHTSWMAKGKAAIQEGKLEDNYSKVFYRLTQAKPKGELVLLESIHDAAIGNGFSENKIERIAGPGVPVEKMIRTQKRQWQAAAWILERTRRENYGKDVVPEKEGADTQEEAGKIFEALDLLINNQIENLESLESDMNDVGPDMDFDLGD